MTANTAPIFGRQPHVEFGGAVIGPTSNTAQDGSGACSPIFQADATNGSFVTGVRLKPVGSPAQTVARLFMCSATGAFTPGTTNTAANSGMLDEIALPAITSSNTLAQSNFEFTWRGPVPAGYRLFVTFAASTGSAGTGYLATALGADY